MRALSLIVVIPLLLVGDLAWGKPPKGNRPKRNPQQQRFTKLDINKDRQVTLPEFLGNREGQEANKAAKRFLKIDKNSDGALTLEEFRAARKPKK